MNRQSRRVEDGMKQDVGKGGEDKFQLLTFSSVLFLSV